VAVIDNSDSPGPSNNHRSCSFSIICQVKSESDNNNGKYLKQYKDLEVVAWDTAFEEASEVPPSF
jgi:hypothetical protein